MPAMDRRAAPSTRPRRPLADGAVRRGLAHVRVPSYRVVAMSPRTEYSEGFDGVADEPDSTFYAAPGLSPEATNREIVASMDHVMRDVVSLHHSGCLIPLTTDSYCEWHHGGIARPSANTRAACLASGRPWVLAL
jgi:hypothetical protein